MLLPEIPSFRKARLSRVSLHRSGVILAQSAKIVIFVKKVATIKVLFKLRSRAETAFVSTTWQDISIEISSFPWIMVFYA